MFAGVRGENLRIETAQLLRILTTASLYVSEALLNDHNTLPPGESQQQRADTFQLGANQSCPEGEAGPNIASEGCQFTT